jgi:D-alanine-D-alanine ligase-like ATP-grasp enzyme
MDKPTTLVSTLLKELIPELGIEIHIEPEYGYVGQIKTKDGRIFYYRNTNFDLNTQGASELAKDKRYTAYFLNLMGYPTPKGHSFYSDAYAKMLGATHDTKAACRYAKTLGYPVIVKPNDKSMGFGVEKVYTEKDLLTALHFIFEESRDNVAAIEEVIEGDDYRIVVLDKEVIAVYRRTPLTVIGDGKHTIAELLQTKYKQFKQIGRRIDLALDDSRILKKLDRLDMQFTTIPAKGFSVVLLDNANLSTGGDAVDVTHMLDDSYKAMAVKLLSDMALRYGGIDIMTTSSIAEPLGKYCVIEVNSAPGLDYYVELGENQRKRVKELYKKVFLALIK